MPINKMIGKTIKKKGLRQNWIVDQMNTIKPDLKMNRNKFSAIVCGNRRMTGDELLAFCKATEINPDDLFTS